MECGSYLDSFIHKTSEIKNSMFFFIFITVTRLEVLNFATWLVLRNNIFSKIHMITGLANMFILSLNHSTKRIYLDTKQRHYCRYRVLLGSQYHGDLL